MRARVAWVLAGVTLVAGGGRRLVIRRSAVPLWSETAVARARLPVRQRGRARLVRDGRPDHLPLRAAPDRLAAEHGRRDQRALPPRPRRTHTGCTRRAAPAREDLASVAGWMSSLLGGQLAIGGPGADVPAGAGRPPRVTTLAVRRVADRAGCAAVLDRHPEREPDQLPDHDGLGGRRPGPRAAAQPGVPGHQRRAHPVVRLDAAPAPVEPRRAAAAGTPDRAVGRPDRPGPDLPRRGAGQQRWPADLAGVDAAVRRLLPAADPVRHRGAALPAVRPRRDHQPDGRRSSRARPSPRWATRCSWSPSAAWSRAGPAASGSPCSATALVALAFQPLRRSVVRLANRLAYGVRAQPYEALADFSSRLAGHPVPGHPAAGGGRGRRPGRLGQRRHGHARHARQRPGVGDLGQGGRHPGPGGPGAERGQRPWAVSSVVVPRGRGLRPSDQRLLEALADQTAVAFRNTALADQPRRTRRGAGPDDAASWRTRGAGSSRPTTRPAAPSRRRSPARCCPTWSRCPTSSAWPARRSRRGRPRTASTAWSTARTRRSRRCATSPGGSSPPS